MNTKFRGIYVFAFICLFGIAVCGVVQAAASDGQTSENQQVSQFVNGMRGPGGAVAGADKIQSAQLSLKNGYLRAIGAPTGHYFPVSNVVVNNPAVTAKNFIAERRAEFGIRSNNVDFLHQKSRTKGGHSYQRFQQTYSQIPVYSSEMIIQLNASGGVEFAVSDIMQETADMDNGTVSTVPSLSADDAGFLAIELMKESHPNLSFTNTTPKLMIYKPQVVGNTGATHLVWYTEVKSASIFMVDEVILIDAHTGEVALHFTQIKDARSRQIYDSDNTNADPGTLKRSEGEAASGIADVDAAYDYLGDTYDFYFTENGRDGINNAGMIMSATVRICPDGYICPFPNAFWDGARMYFGTGFTADDVTAHELTHGVTQYESSLIYLNESGAINESFSDMWGEWIDQVNGKGTDTPAVKWLMGEDIPGMGAIRNMADPTQFGDPDGKCSPFWYSGSGDNGGVHFNSGVGNKLCYLLTDGAVFKNVQITGMGISAVADLMYEVQTNLLTSSATYADLHVALTQAAINLAWTDEQKENLKKACLVVDLSKCFDPADLIQDITPNPMEWEVDPVAVGRTTIFMQAVTASHPSGVQYYIDCETDPANFDTQNAKNTYGNTQFDSGTSQSGWVSDTIYYRGDYATGAQYYFRVRARNLANHQETKWSDIIGPITPAPGLPPYPNPAKWEGTPRKASNGRIAMEGAKAYSQVANSAAPWVSTAIQYFFDCTGTNDPKFPNKDTLDSGWQSAAFYQRAVSSITSPGYYYEFNIKIKTVEGYETAIVDSNKRTAYIAPPSITREVPTATYPTIQHAINSSNNGDTVLVHPGIYREINIDLKGKAITVTSENPENSTIVAATVIDCEEPQQIYAHEFRRAFIIQNGEGRNTVIAGFTIRNATAFDEAEIRTDYGNSGIPDRNTPISGDGTDALGGAILMGTSSQPVSPIIRNCTFTNCFAHGEYGGYGADGPGVNTGNGNPGDRGGNGGNAYGGAIYAYAGSSPYLKNCVFSNCQAIGGNAGNGGNGSDAGDVPGDTGNGQRGGDGGDAGSGGCAWGGAIYFEPNCIPELYNVTVQSCLVQVGEAGFAGDGGNGGNAKDIGIGGIGGNGGIGGDLRASTSSGGAIFFGDNTNATIVDCAFKNCRVVAQLSGDYSGGDGGDGGDGEGDGMPGGDGGNGGPAFMIPPKMQEIGGVDAIGGTGGNGGNGNGGRGNGGNGGFRHGQGGNPGGITFGSHTGIFPSNIYYMAYYWEDTANIDNPQPDPNEFSNFSYIWKPAHAEIVITTPPADPAPGAAEIHYNPSYIFDSPYSPYFGTIDIGEVYSGVLVFEDPNNLGDPAFYSYDISGVNFQNPVVTVSPPIPLTPPTTQRDAGACAGANYYGINSIIKMTGTTVSGNNSFANHGGAELYDKGCDAVFQKCTFEGNQTLYGQSVVTTDYIYEGFGGAIFTDQPVRFVLNECTFDKNNAFSGGAIYCNFAPSDSSNPNYKAPNLDLTTCTFTGNQAISHYMYSYGGAVYAGNSLNPYEEYYFNYLMNYRVTNYQQYRSVIMGNPVAVNEFINFIASIYDHYHGYVNFYEPITTQLWWDELEADHILWGLQSPVYTVPVTDCTFEGNMAPFGGGLYLDASLVAVNGSQFNQNTGEVGAGQFVFASDVSVRDNMFKGNIGTAIESLGSQTDNSAVDTLCNGGSLYVSDSTLEVIDNKFVSNVVDGMGGAMFINGPSLDWSSQRLINNLFVENVAGIEGGALVADGQSDVQVQSCDFVDNSVSDSRYGLAGSMLVHGAFVDVSNSIFWNNKSFYPGAPVGPQIVVGDPYEVEVSTDPGYITYSTAFIDYSDVQGGQADIFVADGEGPWLWYGSNNIEDNLATPADEADPLFVAVTDPADASERTFYLSEIAAGQLANSPCLNKGTGNVSELATILGYNVTTRTDHIADVDPLNLGYHYDASPLTVADYTLETRVYLADLFPHGTLVVTTEPNGLYKTIDSGTSHYLYRFKQGTVVKLLAIPDPFYRVKRWIGTDDDASVDNENQITMSGTRLVSVEFELAVPRNLYVPESYDSIEDAILAARSGDRIILAPRPDVPYLIEDPNGINFKDKDGKVRDLTITSIDPNNSLIRAQTIIDCQGSRYVSKRAFHFVGGETNKSVIQGITIRNAFTAVIGPSRAINTGMWPWPFQTPPDPLPPLRALSGADGTGDSYGGAILCENGSSPTIQKCVFVNCTASGGIGGDGEDGMWPANLTTDEDLDSQSGGHSGKGTGNGYGGAIAILSGSEPNILNCVFENNRATGGWGGIPGNAGRSYNNGRYGWGGNDYSGVAYASVYYGINPQAGYGEGDGFGGALYVDKGCRPTISRCEFIRNSARPGYVYNGGTEADGAAYPEPWDADPWGEDGMRDGRPSYIISEGLSAGGAVYFEQFSKSELYGCTFKENQACEIYTYYDTPVGTRGGAIFIDPNATISILPGPNEEKSVFTGNLAGAIYSSTRSSLTVDGAEFTQNISTLPEDTSTLLTPEYNIAGAITVDPNAKTVTDVNDCQFQDNISGFGGGAIRTLSGMNLTNCVFSGNQSESDGGAIYSFVHLNSPNTQTTWMNIDNCEFSGNSSQGLGGALFVKNVILNINDSFVVQNTAFSGGGIRITYGDFTMTKCLVYGNEATGAIAGAHRTVTDEGFGGGLQIVDSRIALSNTRIEKNVAHGIISTGGGLCITGGQEYYKQRVRNCLLAGNISDNAGGGASVLLYANVNFEYCTFAHNTSGANLGGALYVDQLSTAAFGNSTEPGNSIISGNKGIGIYAKAGGVTTGYDVLFNANQGANVYSNGTPYSGNVVPGYTNLTIADPLFVADGPLGNYYLDQTKPSPAVNKGSQTAAAASMSGYTTDAADTLDTDKVDLGYHYPIETREYMLTTSVVDTDGLSATGTILPVSKSYPRGAILPLSVDIGKEYFLVGWSGGTFSDTSQETTNTVLMSGTKDIKVIVRYRRTLNFGTSSDYDILADAINDAQDGDIILVAPGEYTAASQFPTPTNLIALDGKKITISGYNPNDDTTVRSTVFRDIRFAIGNVNKQTIIEGITLEQSRMLLLNADMILRNCVFRDCRFTETTLVHVGTVPAGTDGYSQIPLTGGALEVWDSSPRIFNCTFEDNWARGAFGENGYAGAQSHPTGGDGGWPGGAYGGAVYCGFSSSPEFIECTFTGNQVFGAQGGNGANGWVNRGVMYNGGRGGGWLYDVVIEEYLKTALNGGWDGWANNAYGDKYSFYSWYADFYGAYDLSIWAKWFNWTDAYSSWEQFAADYLNNQVDPLGDPYDQMMDVWRYSGYGGAVFCESDSDAKFTKCVFENNQSHGGQTGIGGVLVNNTSPWPDRRLNMPTAGGAVFAANDCDLVFTECEFRDNVADISTVDLPHTFQVSFGGAVAYQYDCSAQFVNCDMMGNRSTTGGAVYAFETNSQITDCNVFDNEAYVGAGVYSEDYNLVVSGTTFSSNHARTPAALTAPAESLNFTGTAGGLFAMVDTFTMRDSVFTGNSSSISGGGLLLTGVVTKPSKVFNCLFADNSTGRDGAGASVNWSHQANFGSCTFVNNTAQGLGANAESFGGNLAVNYDSNVSVIDSILWSGSATSGRQFAVTSGYVEDARPSTLSVAFSDIQGGRASTSAHIEDGCTLNWDSPSIFAADPLFVNSAEGDYHLSQINKNNPTQSQTVDSPCLDKGSDFASSLGLNIYTTATPIPVRDTGKVDLGYHYRFELSNNLCRFADFKTKILNPNPRTGLVQWNQYLDGVVDTSDLLVLASWWLTSESVCIEHEGCHGADLDSFGGVDFFDFIYLANCWQEEDTVAPEQVEWDTKPISGKGQTFATMSALETTDNWGNVMYKFVNVTNPSHNSPWRQNFDSNMVIDNNNGVVEDNEVDYVELTEDPNVPWQWIDKNLVVSDPVNGTPYTYRIIVRDPRDNRTVSLLDETVIVGADYNPPTPNPALWVTVPYQNTLTTIRMVAQPATDPEGQNVFYSFSCAENTALNSGWITSNEYVTTAALVVGQTYTFRVKYRDDSTNQNETASSTAVAVVVSNVLDVTPPLPDPPTITAVRVTIGSQGYHVVTASVATDPSGVEYKFECITSGALIGSAVHTTDGWINDLNMVAGVYQFGNTLFPNGTVKIANVIYIPISGVINHTYRVKVRDQSPAHNETQWSATVSTQ